MHDLLRSYAVRLATEEDSEDERRAALTRLFDHHLATAAVAMDAFVPADQHRHPRSIPAPVTQTPPMVGPSEARAWLDAERATLTAACVYTASHGWPDHTIRLATVLSRYLDIGAHYAEAVVIHTHALRVARHTNDRDGAAHALVDLGSTYWRQGRYTEAVDCGQQALTVFREIDNRVGQAGALGILGTIYARQGHYQQAAEHLLRALTLSQEIGNPSGEAAALGNLGTVYERQGHYQRAAEHFQIEHLQQALTLFREIGQRSGEAGALNALGEAYHAAGELSEARIQHAAALDLATEIGDRHEQAHAHNGLARIHNAIGATGQARHHWRQALTLYINLGVPEADAIRAHLAALDQPPNGD